MYLPEFGFFMIYEAIKVNEILMDYIKKQTRKRYIFKFKIH